MKKLMLFLGVIALMSTASVSYASVELNDEVTILDCDKCKDHVCDDVCKKDGCTAKKECTAEEKAKCEKKGEGSKSCCKKGGDAKKSSCHKKGGDAEGAKDAEPKK